MHLEASDPTFIDAFLPSNAGRNDRLDRIDRLIDWPKVAALLDDVHAAPEGRPAYRPVTMVKIIVLQQWYDTSDVGMEEALQDRLSFRRFAAGAAARAGGEGSDHASGAQASDGSSALAAAEERAAVEGSGACGAGVWDAQALLRVLAGSVYGANEERGGGVVQGAEVQLAAFGRVERGLHGAW